MEKNFELFEKNKIEEKNIISNPPRTLYPQERDWTCSIACIRTIIAPFAQKLPSEDFYIEKFKLEPGPLYSKDIKNLNILEEFTVHYGCDFEDVDFGMIIYLLEKGYYIMLESIINYAHWMVLLGYYPNKDLDVEKTKLLMYDPYYDEIKLINADEFLNMWIDGDFEHTKVKKDFIAVKRKNNIL
jgi:hypothetical protein